MYDAYPAEGNSRSHEWWDRANQVIVGGGQQHKRPSKYLRRGGPAFITRAKGPYFWDVDGRKYIDYLLSYGPIVLGHADPRVNEAVFRQMEKGTLYSLESPDLIEFVETFRDLVPSAELAMVLVGGSAATSAAIRTARAHTRKEMVVRCGYHGWHDWCFPSDPGCPIAEESLVKEVPYNSLSAIESVFEQYRGKVAGLIVESIQNGVPDPSYFSGIRKLCDRYGVVFILDEVKTGIRLSLGGAQERYGIDCDLSTFGKALCNGFPGSLLVGKREILEGRSDTWVAGTFHGDLCSVAAANTVLKVMREEDGVSYFENTGNFLMEGLNEVFQSLQYPLKVIGPPAMPVPIQTAADDPVNPLPDELKGKVITEWCAAMQRRGIFVTGHPWFLSLAHSRADIQETIDKGAEAVREANEILETILAGKLEPLPYN